MFFDNALNLNLKFEQNFFLSFDYTIWCRCFNEKYEVSYCGDVTRDRAKFHPGLFRHECQIHNTIFFKISEHDSFVNVTSFEVDVASVFQNKLSVAPQTTLKSSQLELLLVLFSFRFMKFEISPRPLKTQFLVNQNRPFWPFHTVSFIAIFIHLSYAT